MDWIVVIWVRLVKLNGEKEGPTIKMKYRMIINKKVYKKKMDLGRPRPPPRSVLVYKLSTQ